MTCPCQKKAAIPLQNMHADKVCHETTASRPDLWPPGLFRFIAECAEAICDATPHGPSGRDYKENQTLPFIKYNIIALNP